MRLIDADEIIIPCMETTTDDYRVQSMIDEQPTVEAIPVIRCKECKHSDAYNHCTRLSIWNKPEDFCSYAERKEE